MSMFNCSDVQPSIMEELFPHGYSEKALARALTLFRTHYREEKDWQSLQEAIDAFLGHFNLEYDYCYEALGGSFLLECQLKKGESLKVTLPNGHASVYHQLSDVSIHHLRPLCLAVYNEQIKDKAPTFSATSRRYLAEARYHHFVELLKDYVGLETMIKWDYAVEEEITSLEDLLRFCIEPIFYQFISTTAYGREDSELELMEDTEANALTSPLLQTFLYFAQQNHWIFDSEGNLTLF